jgi:beta-glucosidase
MTMAPRIFRLSINLVLLASLFLSACGGQATQTAEVVDAAPQPGETAEENAPVSPSPTPESEPPATGAEQAVTLDPSLPVEQRVDDLLSRMTLEEKLGQMAQVEKNSMPAADVTATFIGSVLSGGGGSPSPNNAENWAQMVDGYQKSALATRLGIPMIYGVDAVHGHNNLFGATVFPHNIGLGAANDTALMEQIGRATAEEMAATGIRWNFAPVVAVVQDIRWGRTYEGYSEEPAIVTALSTAYLTGLQTASAGGSLSDPLAVIGTPKHYLGDGATTWGTSTNGSYQIDQGDMRFDEAAIRKYFLPPYQAAVQAGARSIMVSFSSWNGEKMHAQKYLITEVLKGELGFTGFVVSDWGAIDQIPGEYSSDVVTSINAGIDMVMIPYDYKTFLSTLKQAVEKGDIPQDRIDDAVRRILRVKFELGLFEHPYADPAYLPLVGSAEHRSLARLVVSKSLVLLKNENQALPISKETPLLLVAGVGADNIGMQCGGWTIDWQGKLGNITPGTSILAGVQQAVGAGTRVEFDRVGVFKDLTQTDGSPLRAEVGIAVVGENPYAEGQGDRGDLSLSAKDLQMVTKLRERVDKLILVVLSGRPLVLGKALEQADAVVAAWLPGTEGAGVADGLFGVTPFTGKLPYAWPATNDQLPLGPAYPDSAQKTPLFPLGFGLEK